MEFKEKRPLYALEELASILRAESGCAWDRAQTSRTLKPYLIEEAYEVYEAIDSGDPENLREELGDLLYQVYAHAQIAREENRFTIDDVARGIVEKLVYRHPHVFGGEKASSANEVIERWESIKKKEKEHRESILEGVPAHLPSLLKAYRVQQKVSRVGFDWEKTEDVIAKLDEEVAEFKEALSSKPDEGWTARMEDEMGDILFSMVNIARFLDINAEDALNRTVNKFINRFRTLEKEASARGRKLEEMTLTEMDELWEAAKLR
ncbi:MAG TPA: nucleoside triphosphate pyrophosphohydrolase [Spirochaetota bacterium]|nr:nucleoside triphosphate pyrophosphohydrolase [Spirochaetota bacterium]